MPTNTLEDHPARIRWNKKYQGNTPFRCRPSALLTAFSQRIPLDGLPPGDVLELACGISGNALALARLGRRVVAVDIADAGLDRLADHVEKAGLGHAIRLIQADLLTWTPPARDFALVICARYWDSTVFRYAHRRVMPGGYLAWEGFSPRESHWPHAKYAMQAHEPLSLLPTTFSVVECRDVDEGRSAVYRRLIARRDPWILEDSPEGRI